MSYIQMCPEQYLECYTKSDQCCLIILNEEESYITIKITRNHLLLAWWRIYFPSTSGGFVSCTWVTCISFSQPKYDAICFGTFPCAKNTLLTSQFIIQEFLSSFEDYINTFGQLFRLSRHLQLWWTWHVYPWYRDFICTRMQSTLCLHLLSLYWVKHNTFYSPFPQWLHNIRSALVSFNMSWVRESSLLTVYRVKLTIIFIINKEW